MSLPLTCLTSINIYKFLNQDLLEKWYCIRHLECFVLLHWQFSFLYLQDMKNTNTKGTFSGNKSYYILCGVASQWMFLLCRNMCQELFLQSKIIKILINRTPYNLMKLFGHAWAEITRPIVYINMRLRTGHHVEHKNNNQTVLFKCKNTDLLKKEWFAKQTSVTSW